MSAKVGFVLKEDQRGGRANSTEKQPSRKQISAPSFYPNICINNIIPKPKPKPKPKSKSYVFKVHPYNATFFFDSNGCASFCFYIPNSYENPNPKPHVVTLLFHIHRFSHAPRPLPYF